MRLDAEWEMDDYKDIQNLLTCCKCVCVCEGVYKCVRTCLSPAELSGFSAKDDFISHTQITFVFDCTWESLLSLAPPCVHVCLLVCQVCVWKSGQRSAAAGLTALRVCSAV